jgi:hypothetical protein
VDLDESENCYVNITEKKMGSNDEERLAESSNAAIVKTP